MVSLPPLLAVRYRIATTREIRSWSFGQLESRRAKDATHWQEQRGTIDDQRIFGPLQDLECACGKYQGTQHRGMICDRCGVKVTSPSVRRERFGHIELGAELRHPFGQDADRLATFPVLPAVFVGSSAGCRLVEYYERLAEEASTAAVAQETLNRLAELLLPAVVFAHEWRLVEASLLAQGLAIGPDLHPRMKIVDGKVQRVRTE
jgi:DNA-directed RNA polymerase beta' subunit